MGGRPTAGLFGPPLGRAAAALVAFLCASCTEAPGGCRGEVAAAFERLRTSGRPYRKETTIAVDHRQDYRQTAEFIPPDRMREVTSDRTGTSELIRVGARAWSNRGGAEWREWEPGLAQALYGAGMDFLLLPDRVVPADAAFTCLGLVELKGAMYIGYRAKLDKMIATVSFPSVRPRDKEREEKKREELVSKLERMPQEWRTVLVDHSSGLPVYDLIAEENRLDNPRYEFHFTYPAGIKIDPPFR